MANKNGNQVKHIKRKSICDKYNGKCAYCNRQVGMKGTLDHYLPKSLGGTDCNDNLKWSCIECNTLKADMSPEEWEDRIPVIQIQKTKYEQKIELLKRSIKKTA